ncbi:MAG: AbrB/MazE/SpoVT family DNA-binding domain-containing protein [Deltaproteobacteria bacterium]|nr:AbrB/MazE/SpoVT family DNA-binding domain-containing protein [Deltaproteobacteria bacterium]
MRAKIIKIGNSRGIRLPKPLLEQTGIRDDVELTVEGDRIIVHSIAEPRAGWDSEFKAMSEAGDDAVIDGADGLSHPWDENEWQW